MLEKIGDKDIIVCNYVDNFNVKEYIQNVMMPKAFPDIPITKLNVGFHGLVSEYMAQAVEDSHATSSLMYNEAFLTKAMLPESIYAKAAEYNIGYTYAKPSTCSFALQIKMSDILANSEAVQNSTTMRYILDKDTRVLLGENTYRLDYDVYIDHVYIDGKLVFNVYYNIEETNSIAVGVNQYIKHQSSQKLDWLVLFMDLKQFNRTTDTVALTDNFITTNSDIDITWVNQIAGIDLIYISPQGQRIPMKLNPKYTKADIEPFVWYRMIEDNEMMLSFCSNDGYWSPEFNSKVEYTIYTTLGKAGDFNSYDRKSGIPVKKSGERFPYNTETTMVAICYSGSTGGLDRGNVETVRDNALLAMNTCNVLTSAHDLQLWFENTAKRYGTKAEFFKRRDDPTGQLFSQFIAIKNDSYVYPTNTLNIRVEQEDFDFVNSDAAGNNQEFIIKPGHLWEYDDQGEETTLDRLRMIKTVDGYAMVTDETLPAITAERPFIFVNPFCIKINKYPTVSMNYNYLINHTEWPEEDQISTTCFYQFQLAQMSIERTLDSKHNNMYHIEVICVPTVTNEDIDFVAGIGPEEYPLVNNKLRLVLVTKTVLDGETGYIEMVPTELRNGGAILFETDIAVYDNLQADMMIQIDTTRCAMTSLISAGDRAGKVFIDSNEAMFNVLVMMQDESATSILYNNPTFEGYVMANRFHNNHRDLILYKPMSMMLNTIEFSGVNDDYTVDVSMMPFLRYDIPLDEEKMLYFIQAFSDQYAAMEPVLSKLDGNAHIDFKLYNTYGRSRNYYIGPMDGEPVLKNSTILLDNVYVRVRLIISVYDRSLYTQTVNEVTNEISTTFASLNSEQTDIHVSEIIHNIMTNNSNVRYLRFLGFNNYDANKQSIFVKYSNISELSQDSLMSRVPEIIRADSSSIEISEET